MQQSVSCRCKLLYICFTSHIHNGKKSARQNNYKTIYAKPLQSHDGQRPVLWKRVVHICPVRIRVTVKWLVVAIDMPSHLSYRTRRTNTANATFGYIIARLRR